MDTKTRPMVIGFCCSAFDLLHAGHVASLKEAKTQCDYLIAALHIDPSTDRKEKNKPVESTLERFIKLQGCRYVDEIIPYDNEEDLYNLLAIIKPDVRFLGEEYKTKDFTGSDLGFKVFYHSRKHNFSSSNLRKRINANS